MPLRCLLGRLAPFSRALLGYILEGPSCRISCLRSLSTWSYRVHSRFTYGAAVCKSDRVPLRTKTNFS